MGQIEFLGGDLESVQDQLNEMGYPSYRFDQIHQWVFEKGIVDTNKMHNLPQDLVEKLVILKASVDQEKISQDGTKKLRLNLADGAKIETVGIPMGDDQLTLCVSSQSGCAMACIFCATGTITSHRNLKGYEIIEQFLLMWSLYGHKPHRVVFMGMGEPLLNRNGLQQSLNILIKHIKLSKRKITVSTVGLIDGIRWLVESKFQINLAISLHSALDETRQILVPTLKTPVQDLIQCALEYRQETSRDVTLEVVLIRDLNDDVKHARALAQLAGRGLSVNLIPYNYGGAGSWRAPLSDNIMKFKDVLNEFGVIYTQRKARGHDIQAACGELATKN